MLNKKENSDSYRSQSKLEQIAHESRQEHVTKENSCQLLFSFPLVSKGCSDIGNNKLNL